MLKIHRADYTQSRHSEQTCWTNNWVHNIMWYSLRFLWKVVKLCILKKPIISFLCWTRQHSLSAILRSFIGARFKHELGNFPFAPSAGSETTEKKKKNNKKLLVNTEGYVAPIQLHLNPRQMQATQEIMELRTANFLRDAMDVCSRCCHLCFRSQGSVKPQCRQLPGSNVRCHSVPGAQGFLWWGWLRCLLMGQVARLHLVSLVTVTTWKTLRRDCRFLMGQLSYALLETGWEMSSEK